MFTAFKLDILLKKSFMTLILLLCNPFVYELIYSFIDLHWSLLIFIDILIDFDAFWKLYEV